MDDPDAEPPLPCTQELPRAATWALGSSGPVVCVPEVAFETCDAPAVGAPIDIVPPRCPPAPGIPGIVAPGVAGSVPPPLLPPAEPVISLLPRAMTSRAPGADPPVEGRPVPPEPIAPFPDAPLPAKPLPVLPLLPVFPIGRPMTFVLE